MSKISYLTRAALRELNVISSFDDITPEQSLEIRVKLYSLVKSTFSDIVGYNLKDWQFVAADGVRTITDATGFKSVLSSPWQIEPNARVLCGLEKDTKAGDEAELKLNPYPQDGERLEIVGNFASPLLVTSSNYISIEGEKAIVISGSAVSTYSYFYRSDLMNWLRLPQSFMPDDDFIFPDEFDGFFIASLAVSIGNMYGMALPQVLIDRMQEGKAAIKLRYSQGKLDASTKLDALA